MRAMGTGGEVAGLVGVGPEGLRSGCERTGAVTGRWRAGCHEGGVGAGSVSCVESLEP